MKKIKINITVDNVWFIADTHLNHANVIKYCNRPFSNINEMDKEIIINWNERIEEDDKVFILGDFCFGSKNTWKSYLNELNGHKILIEGNHDKNITYDEFEIVTPLADIIIEGDEEITDGQKITLCHYPMISWYQSHRGSWQLYGHVHGKFSNKKNTPVTPNQLDVGVDVHEFSPISYDTVKEIITRQNLK